MILSTTSRTPIDNYPAPEDVFLRRKINADLNSFKDKLEQLNIQHFLYGQIDEWYHDFCSEVRSNAMLQPVIANFAQQLHEKLSLFINPANVGKFNFSHLLFIDLVQWLKLQTSLKISPEIEDVYKNFLDLKKNAASSNEKQQKIQNIRNKHHKLVQQEQVSKAQFTSQISHLGQAIGQGISQAFSEISNQIQEDTNTKVTNFNQIEKNGKTEIQQVSEGIEHSKSEVNQLEIDNQNLQVQIKSIQGLVSNLLLLY